VFAAEDDPFFPHEAVLARLRELFANLARAECLRGCRHVPSKAALGRVNEEIRGSCGVAAPHSDRPVTAPRAAPSAGPSGRRTPIVAV